MTTETFENPENTNKTILYNGMTLSEIIAENLSLLDEKYRNIVQRHYGLDGNARETLQQIGNSHDVTRERIRQIEVKAKRKLGTEHMTRTLVAALKQVKTLEKLFRNHKVISEQRIHIARKLLTAEERLAIDLAYGDLKSFLDTEAIKIKAGWMQEHDPELMNRTENITGTLKWRLKSAIQNIALPIRLSEIASFFPDYSLPEIRDALSLQYGATFEGDLVEKCFGLPISIQCTLVLREAGHPMRFNEIRTRILEVFGIDKNTHYIGNTLANQKDFLIVGNGTYDLYENLSLSKDDLEEIRTRAFHHLKNIDDFISSNILFSDLFQGDSEKFGTAFGHHMLFGILQNDGRFRTRRRMKVSLAVASDDNSD